MCQLLGALEIAAPVVDNQPRTLVGAPVYRLPAGQITHEHYITARERCAAPTSSCSRAPTRAATFGFARLEGG